MLNPKLNYSITVPSDCYIGKMHWFNKKNCSLHQWALKFSRQWHQDCPSLGYERGGPGLEYLGVSLKDKKHRVKLLSLGRKQNNWVKKCIGMNVTGVVGRGTPGKCGVVSRETWRLCA